MADADEPWIREWINSLAEISGLWPGMCCGEEPVLALVRRTPCASGSKFVD